MTVYLLYLVFFVLQIAASTSFQYPQIVAAWRSASREYKRFICQFLLVFGLASASEWIRSAYTLHVLQYYRFNGHASKVFMVTYLTSGLVTGLFVGATADRWGRKCGCLLYCLMSILSSLFLFVDSMAVIMLSRMLGGVATAILLTSFESWLVCEHTSRRYAHGRIVSAFVFMHLVDGAGALLGGYFGQRAVALSGGSPFAPFLFCILLNIVGAVLTLRYFTENYGDRRRTLFRHMMESLQSVRRDQNIFALTVVQALIEAATLLFMMIWTPALLLWDDLLPYGLVFTALTAARCFGHSIVCVVLPFMNRSALYLFVPTAVAMLLCRASHLPLYMVTSFMFYSVCVGVLQPVFAVIRSQSIFEMNRAATLGMMRVPTCLIVTAALGAYGGVNSQNTHSIMGMCTALCIAAILAYALMRTRSGKRGAQLWRAAYH